MNMSSRTRVLIVDDSKLTRVSLKTTLQNAAQWVELVGEAEDGAQGVEMTQQLHPDIVLMDVGMPIMDGITATQHIRQRAPETKVIMLTSHEEGRDVLDAFNSGATSYCLKETAPDVLLHVIQSTVGGACWIDPKIAHILVSQVQVRPEPPAASNTPAVGNSSPEPVNATSASFATTNARSNDESSTLCGLSEREVEVLRLIADGMNNGEICERLSISMNTLKTHIKNIFSKLGVEDRTAAALKAIKDRIV